MRLLSLRVLRAVSKNWAMLWQTAMLVVVVLFIFAAVGTAAFEDDFALGQATEATRDDGDAEDFSGCSTLGEVRACVRKRLFVCLFVCFDCIYAFVLSVCVVCLVCLCLCSFVCVCVFFFLWCVLFLF